MMRKLSKHTFYGKSSLRRWIYAAIVCVVIMSWICIGSENIASLVYNTKSSSAMATESVSSGTIGEYIDSSSISSSSEEVKPSMLGLRYIHVKNVDFCGENSTEILNKGAFAFAHASVRLKITIDGFTRAFAKRLQKLRVSIQKYKVTGDSRILEPTKLLSESVDVHYREDPQTKSMTLDAPTSYTINLTLSGEGVYDIGTLKVRAIALKSIPKANRYFTNSSFVKNSYENTNSSIIDSIQNPTGVRFIVIDNTRPSMKVMYEDKKDGNTKYFNHHRIAHITVKDANFSLMKLLQNDAIASTDDEKSQVIISASDFIKDNKSSEIWHSTLNYDDGDWRVIYRVTDMSGNKSEYVKNSFIVDTKDPNVEISDIASNKTYEVENSGFPFKAIVCDNMRLKSFLMRVNGKVVIKWNSSSKSESNNINSDSEDSSYSNGVVVKNVSDSEKLLTYTLEPSEKLYDVYVETTDFVGRTVFQKIENVRVKSRSNNSSNSDSNKVVNDSYDSESSFDKLYNIVRGIIKIPVSTDKPITNTDQENQNSVNSGNLGNSGNSGKQKPASSEKSSKKLSHHSISPKKILSNNGNSVDNSHLKNQKTSLKTKDPSKSQGPNEKDSLKSGGDSKAHNSDSNDESYGPIDKKNSKNKNVSENENSILSSSYRLHPRWKAILKERNRVISHDLADAIHLHSSKNVSNGNGKNSRHNADVAHSRFSDKTYDSQNKLRNKSKDANKNDKDLVSGNMKKNEYSGDDSEDSYKKDSNDDSEELLDKDTQKLISDAKSDSHSNNSNNSMIILLTIGVVIISIVSVLVVGYVVYKRNGGIFMKH